MKKSLSMIASALMAFSLMSCATTLSVTRTNPSELDLTGSKTIAILPMDYYNTNPNFINDQKFLAEKFLNRLKSYAYQDTKFTLVDETTIRESIKQGFAVPADILVKPIFTRFDVTDSGITLETKASDGSTIVTKDAWKRIIAGDMDITVTRASDRTVLGTKHFDWFKGNNDDLPKASLPSPQSSLLESMDTYAYITAEMIFDTQVMHAIQLKESKDKNLKADMKKANDLAKSKQFEASQKAYADIYASTKDFAAGYNSAIMLQAMEKHDEALQVLNALYETNPDKSVTKAIQDVTKEKIKKDILDSRNNK